MVLSCLIKSGQSFRPAFPCAASCWFWVVADFLYVGDGLPDHQASSWLPILSGPITPLPQCAMEYVQAKWVYGINSIPISRKQVHPEGRQLTLLSSAIAAPAWWPMSARSDAILVPASLSLSEAMAKGRALKLALISQPGQCTGQQCCGGPASSA